jgi:hypothetical protein
MGKTKESPSLLQDLGAIAGLYRGVFTLMGRRMHYGPDWEQHLTRESLRFDALEPGIEPGEEQRESSRVRQHVHN